MVCPNAGPFRNQPNGQVRMSTRARTDPPRTHASLSVPCPLLENHRENGLDVALDLLGSDWVHTGQQTALRRQNEHGRH